MLELPRGVLAIAVAGLIALPVPVLAGDHVVSSAELQKEVAAASAARRRNEARLRAFLSSDAAKNALAAAKLDMKKVEKAIPSMSDEELARLAAQSAQVQNDFAAGRLTNTQVTYIILGAILIIVIAILAG